MLWIWIGAMIVFGAVEAATVNMVSVWFVGGALAALIAQIAGAQLIVQVLVFFIVSGALLLCLLPVVRKHITMKRIPTNLDMMIGKEAIITETVDNLLGTGALKVEGKEWSVRSVHGENLQPGTHVRIVKIEGVRLYVEPTGAAVS